MSPLEAAQAEVARLEALAMTATMTVEEKNNLYTAMKNLEALTQHLGAYIEPNHGNGRGRTVLKTITDIQSRLDALEAAASKTISLTMPEIPSWDDITDRPTDLSKIAPATVSETVAAGETIQTDDGRVYFQGYLLGDPTAPMDVQHAFNRDTAGVPWAYQMPWAEGCRPSSKTVEAARQSAETMPDQAFKTTILDRASIVFTKDGRDAMLVEDFQRFVGNHMKQHSVDRATIQDRDETVAAMMAENAELFDQSDADAATIATLKTEIATRDRLLDDQCQTIAKLEDRLSKAIEALRGVSK